MNNPQAFPSTDFECGMTLRDYFAARAMQAIIGMQIDCGGPTGVAVAAYEAADAMLAEREKTK